MKKNEEAEHGREIGLQLRYTGSVNLIIHTHARAHRNASGGFSFPVDIYAECAQNTAGRLSCAVLLCDFTERA